MKLPLAITLSVAMAAPLVAQSDRAEAKASEKSNISAATKGLERPDNPGNRAFEHITWKTEKGKSSGPVVKQAMVKMEAKGIFHASPYLEFSDAEKFSAPLKALKGNGQVQKVRLSFSGHAAADALDGTVVEIAGVTFGLELHKNNPGRPCSVYLVTMQDDASGKPKIKQTGVVMFTRGENENSVKCPPVLIEFVDAETWSLSVGTRKLKSGLRRNPHDVSAPSIAFRLGKESPNATLDILEVE